MVGRRGLRISLASPLWRHPDFLRLWSAQTISQLGTQVTALALPLVAILVLDASAFEVAALGVAEFLPFTLLALPAGVWVDRLPRRPILIVADWGRAAALLSVPIAHVADVLTLWQLYAVGFAVGSFTVFFDVAYQSYLPSLVPRDRLVDGNSKLEVSRSGAYLVGPGLGGALVAVATAPYAILVDAISFVCSALFLSAIRGGEDRPTPLRERPRMRAEIAEGLRYVLGDAYLRPSLAFVAASNFFGQVMFAITLVYAVRSLELSPGVIGLVLALGNVGFLAGAALSSRVSARLGIGPTMVAAAAVTGWPLLLVPAAPQEQPVPFLVVGLLLVSFGGVTYNVTALSLMQAITPDRLLGRMNASSRFLVWGVIPLGGLAGGALASTIGLRPTLWIGAVGSSLAFVPLLFSPLRTLLTTPEVDEVALARADVV